MRAAAADREVSDEGIVYGDLSGSEQLAGYQKAGNFTYSDCSLCRMRDPVQHFAGKGNSGCADPGGNRSSVSGIGICKPWCDRCGRWLYPAGTGNSAGYGNLYSDAMHRIFSGGVLVRDPACDP